MTRVAIIGAGPIGLSALRAFQSAKSNGEDIPEVVCFERQDDWGGLWKYTWRTGLDANGEPVHCSMYRYLWSNGPKECLEFADYTFDEHFGKEIASYPPRAVLFDYIEGRLKKSVARDWIRFNTPVRSVVYNEGSDNFTVTVHDHSKSHTYSEDFDFVINASGHFSTPNVPYFEGIDWFKGRVLHAHDFRDALEFKGKDILIVGASYSAEDIGSQCWKYGAKSITLAYRTAPPGYTWPDNWDERTNLVKVDGNTCHFEDGSSKDFDAIILCTGYLHHYPWLGDDLRLQDINRCWLIDLYQSVVWIKNPKLMYIGAQDQWFTFNMFDAQAWWARDVIMGKISLPSREEMEADSKIWLDKEDACETPEDAWRHQGAYTQRLIDDTDYPSFDMEAVYAEFYNWKKNKKAGIMTFRDKPHKSAMTGKTSPPHHTPWVDALDDSLEAYLSDTPEAAE